MVQASPAALVTGGARRVGRAIALELARCGCDVVVHFCTSKLHAESLIQEIQSLGRNALSVCADLRDPCSWPKIISAIQEQWGRLDFLVNNASSFPDDGSDNMESWDPATWDSLWRLHVLAPAGLAHAAADLLRASRRGVIVNMCDIVANRPWTKHLGYSVTKAALVSLTKGLAKVFAPDVRVLGVSPGIAEFPDGFDDRARRRLIEKIPLGRIGSPEEIGRIVRFLIFDAPSVTGEIINIDGGRSVTW